jgi:hypothetical protein
MSDRRLAKLTARLPFLGVSIILVFSLVVSLTITDPQTAHAVPLPAYRYTKTFDSSAGNVQPNSVATDAQGNVYVAGYFSDTIVFDGTSGSDSHTSANNDTFLTKYNANGSYAYTKTFDTSAGSAQTHSVATDAQGNVYVAGEYTGTVVFDGTGGSDSRTAGGGDDGSFLTKYNANGTYAFTKTFDSSAGSAYAGSTGVATDPQGNVYVTGFFAGTVVFDGTGGSDSQTAVNEDTFLTKYNANGSYAYTKTFDASAANFVDSNSVATDPQGNVYIAGSFNGTVVFDGTGGSDSQTAGGGNNDGFLTKYNANGSYAYTKTFDTSASGAADQTNSVATDPQGNVYVAGDYTGTVVFDGTGGSDSQTSAASFSNFLTKYSPNGSYAYTKTFDASAGSAQGGVVTTDAQGGVYIAGYFNGTVVFDGTGGSDPQTSATDDASITKYNANGSYAYTKTFDTSASGTDAHPRGITTDPQGNAYLAGYFGGTVVFDGTGGSDSQTAGGGNQDGFLTSFQVFVPSQPGPAAAAPASALVPGAPNTGFGVFRANPLHTLALCILISLGLVGLAETSRRIAKEPSK